MSASWLKKSTAFYTTARKLKDNGMYVISIFDMEPAGLLVRAYNQTTSAQYSLALSESEVAAAALSRKEPALISLAASIDLCEVGGGTFIFSSLPGVNMPKVIPTGDDARRYINDAVLKDGSKLTEFLTTALSELAKKKPAGLDAVQWLGEYMLKNNPNQPGVEEPDD